MVTFTVGAEFELAMAVIVAPLLVFSAGRGTAGGFRRLAGAGGADLRCVVPDFGLIPRATAEVVAGRLIGEVGECV